MASSSVQTTNDPSSRTYPREPAMRTTPNPRHSYITCPNNEQSNKNPSREPKLKKSHIVHLPVPTEALAKTSNARRQTTDATQARPVQGGEKGHVCLCNLNVEELRAHGIWIGVLNAPHESFDACDTYTDVVKAGPKTKDPSEQDGKPDILQSRQDAATVSCPCKLSKDKEVAAAAKSFDITLDHFGTPAHGYIWKFRIPDRGLFCLLGSKGRSTRTSQGSHKFWMQGGGYSDQVFVVRPLVKRTSPSLATDGVTFEEVHVIPRSRTISHATNPISEVKNSCEETVKAGNTSGSDQQYNRSVNFWRQAEPSTNVESDGPGATNNQVDYKPVPRNDGQSRQTLNWDGEMALQSKLCNGDNHSQQEAAPQSRIPRGYSEANHSVPDRRPDQNLGVGTSVEEHTPMSQQTSNRIAADHHHSRCSNADSGNGNHLSAASHLHEPEPHAVSDETTVRQLRRDIGSCSKRRHDADHDGSNKRTKASHSERAIQSSGEYPAQDSSLGDSSRHSTNAADGQDHRSSWSKSSQGILVQQPAIVVDQVSTRSGSGQEFLGLSDGSSVGEVGESSYTAGEEPVATVTESASIEEQVARPSGPPGSFVAPVVSMHTSTTPTSTHELAPSTPWRQRRTIRRARPGLSDLQIVNTDIDLRVDGTSLQGLIGLEDCNNVDDFLACIRKDLVLSSLDHIERVQLMFGDGPSNGVIINVWPGKQRSFEKMISMIRPALEGCVVDGTVYCVDNSGR